MGHKRNIKNRKAPPNVQPASLTLKIVAYICLAVGISSIWWIGQLNMDNIKNAAVFFISFAIIGLVISIPFYVILYKTVPELKNKQPISKNWATYINCFGLGLFFMSPSIASTIVKNNFIKNKSCSEYKILRKGSSIRENQEHYFFVTLDGEEERIVVPTIVWDKLKVGQPIKLCIQKGILNTEYIKLGE